MFAQHGTVRLSTYSAPIFYVQCQAVVDTNVSHQVELDVSAPPQLLPLLLLLGERRVLPLGNERDVGGNNGLPACCETQIGQFKRSRQDMEEKTRVYQSWE
jgi:hypothetical protein